VAAAAGSLPDLSQVTALSKTFLRDSAELPMDVAVQTKATDAKGKKKRDAHSRVQFLFKGYNGAAQRYSFQASSGLMGLRILHDSSAPNFAVINAFTGLAPHGADPADVIIEPGAADGAFTIRSKPSTDCKDFQMEASSMYPRRYCYSVLFHVTAGEDGKLSVQDFAVDINKLPAPGNVRYLGAAQVRKIHSEGQVQEARLGNDPQPFLIPKHVETTFETDKGTVVVTSDYTLHTGK
jgi:hypothetical protein